MSCDSQSMDAWATARASIQSEGVWGWIRSSIGPAALVTIVVGGLIVAYVTAKLGGGGR